MSVEGGVCLRVDTCSAVVDMDNKNGYVECNNANQSQKLSSTFSLDMHNHSSKNSQEANGSRKSSRERLGRMKHQSNTSLSSLNSQGSFGSRTTEGSLDESPKKLLGKFHQAVRIGRGTKKLLNKWKTHSTSIDNASEEGDNATDDTSLEKVLGQESIGDNVKKSSWSEHVWSTFIHRGYSDDVTDNEPLVIGKDLLTDFQQDKFKYFFYHVLDLNTDHVISAELRPQA